MWGVRKHQGGNCLQGMGAAPLLTALLGLLNLCCVFTYCFNEVCSNINMSLLVRTSYWRHQSFSTSILIARLLQCKHASYDKRVSDMVVVDGWSYDGALCEHDSGATEAVGLLMFSCVHLYVQLRQEISPSPLNKS